MLQYAPMRRVLKWAGITAALLGVAAILERRFVAAPHYEGPPSDHFDGTRFRNRHPDWGPEGSFLKWQATRKRGAWREWVGDPPGPAPERSVDGGRLRVTLINHATTLIQIDGLNLLTDPIWSERCSPVTFAGPRRHRPPGIRFEDLPKIDAVLVSHNHYDHLDTPTLRRLRAPIITPLGNDRLLRRHGIKEVTPLDWWIGTPIGRASITVVPAQHFSARGLSDRNANLWGGFVIRSASGTVFFAGDTGWGWHFAEVAKRFAPIRLAIFPIGAYEPRWFMKPAHINPAEAVDAHLTMKAGTSIPMHYGTFELSDEGELEPIRKLQRAIAEKKADGFWILGFGEGRDIP